MQRRLLAAIAAVILAGIGAILLFTYVSTADTRAMQGQNPTNVMVVTTEIPVNTPGSQIGSFVVTKQLPAAAVPEGAVKSLDQIATLVAATNILVGEQVMVARFAPPGTTSVGEIAVEDDKQLLTLALEPQRLVGGKLTAGSKVAVYATYDEKTKQIVQNVTVARIGEGDSIGQVTLALTPKDALNVILGNETGKIWLALEAKNPAVTSPNSAKELVR